jgi:hypothetical protein
VFAQSPEPFRPGRSYYRPEQVERALGRPERGWLPAEWVWFRGERRRQRGDCCGIFGGARLDFIRHFSDLGLRVVKDPANERAWADLEDKAGHMILPEQYLLAACAEYHRAAPDSPFAGLRLEHLFARASDAHDPAVVREAGYTHLIAGAKRNPVVTARLEERVRTDYPAHYERAAALAR